MCRASEAFKTGVLKNACKKIWTKNSNWTVKNKHNIVIKNLNFLILAVVGWFWLKKYFKLFFSNILIPYPKIPLISLLENIPYFNFLTIKCWAMSIYNFLLLRPCTLVVLETSQNRFGFFINLVNSFKILGREENLWRPYRI